MSPFVPDIPSEATRVPYYEEARAVDGWAGHTTTKNLKRLQAEVSAAIERLGGVVISFQKGRFDERDGFRIIYTLDVNSGTARGQLDIAALPVRDKWNDTKRERSLKMAMYMLREALAGTWFLQQLSPGYAPLMPWMIGQDGKTITQLWAEHSEMSNLLPPPEDWVEGEMDEGE